MQEPAMNRSRRTDADWEWKYALERALGAAGLAVLSPLLLGVSALIKLTSRGPVLYVSERLGRHGAIFNLYKFRSMRVNAPQVLADDGKVVTLDNDPRLTPIGRVLRLGFDELPQLINVARGEMCLIGPRPDIPWELPRYSDRERLRLRVLPGITGLTQIVDGRSMNNAQNYELDVRYVEQATVWMDLGILLLTLPYSLGARTIGQRLFARHLRGLDALDDRVSQNRGTTPR